MWSVVISMFLLVSVSADRISFNDCGSEFDLEEVDIKGCTGIPCTVVIGDKFTVTMKFRANVPSSSLKQNVRILVFGLPEVVQVTPSDPCTQLDCPSTAGMDNFEAIVDANTRLPPVPGVLKWIITNQSGVQVICMETDLKLVDPLRKSTYKYKNPESLF